MRVMFAVFPATAHFFPMVPHAWALRNAGHEVRVVTVPGSPTGVAVPNFAEKITQAGLNALSCGSPEALSVMDSADPALVPTLEGSESYARHLELSPTEQPHWDVFYHFLLTTVRNYHPPRPRQDIVALIEFARQWRPDLVLWDPWFPAGGVAARACGAAHARVLNALDYSAWVSPRFVRAKDRNPQAPSNPLVETLSPLAEKYGFPADEETLHGQWTIDPFPESMRLPTQTRTVPVRYTPFNGGDVVPDWLLTRPSRPRVVISLGVSTREANQEDWGRTSALMEAVAGIDVDVVATLNASQLEDLRIPLPGNVRTVDYMPLNQLLPGASAIIHHGANGTFAAAMEAGVPQLVCDTDERPRFVCDSVGGSVNWRLMCQKQITATPVAEHVAKHGAGLRINHQTQSVAQIRSSVLEVVRGSSYALGARSLRQEWANAPSPAAIVPVLEKLTSEHRCG